MRKLLLSIAIAAIVAAPAYADLEARLTGGTGITGGDGKSYIGGAFHVDGQLKAEWKTAGIVADYSGTYATFQTFCVEAVTFLTNTWYDVTIDDVIKYDGTTHAPSAITKSAYAYFRMGSFDESVDGFSSDEQKALQALMWDLEGVLSPVGVNGDNYTQLSATVQGIYNNLYIQASALHSATSRVKVMNLWELGFGGENPDAQYDRQSQLVLMVPLPGAMLLGVLGLGLARWARRRMA